MARKLHKEWYNENTYRKYPFGDNSTLTTVDGVVLPLGLIVDAMLHPLILEGVPYLQSLDTISNFITIADSVTDEVILQGSVYTGATDSSLEYIPCRLYDLDNYYGGELTLNKALYSNIAPFIYVFEASATLFTADWFFARSSSSILQSISGLRKDIAFQASAGTKIELRGNILRFSFSGTREDKPPIRTIMFLTEGCSSLLASPNSLTGNDTINITVSQLLEKTIIEEGKPPETLPPEEILISLEDLCDTRPSRGNITPVLNPKSLTQKELDEYCEEEPEDNREFVYTCLPNLVRISGVISATDLGDSRLFRIMAQLVAPSVSGYINPLQVIPDPSNHSVVLQLKGVS